MSTNDLILRYMNANESINTSVSAAQALSIVIEFGGKLPRKDLVGILRSLIDIIESQQEVTRSFVQLLVDLDDRYDLPPME